jgi:hypothetical protein
MAAHFGGRVSTANRNIPPYAVAPSTNAISRLLSPYNSYTNRSISRSVASIRRQLVAISESELTLADID